MRLQPVACVCIAVSCVISRANAQSHATLDSGPTIGETLEFIGGFSQSYVRVPVGGGPDPGEVKSFKTGDCDIALNVDYRTWGALNPAKDYTIKIDLRKVDPLSLGADSGGRLRFQGTGGTPTIKWVHISWRGGSPREKADSILTPELSLMVAGGRQNTDRYYRAWKHALELCGARVSPF